MHCDHTVHVSADLSSRWIVQCSGHPDTIACPLIPSRLFPVLPGGEAGRDVQTRRDIPRTVEDRGQATIVC